MPENTRITRKQTRLLEGLLVGQTIVAASAAIGINEKTARLWLKRPEVIAERERLETEVRQAEEAEIQRILTSGYAAIHERVKALDYQAREMEKPYVSESGNVYHLRNSPDHMREWRGLLDDIAKETGGRVKKSEVEHSGMIDLLNSEHAALLADLADLPDVSQKQTEVGTATASTD